MAIVFPVAPVDGQAYTVGARTWYYHASDGTWKKTYPPGLYMHATGGTETTINVGGVNFRVHDFTASGVLTILRIGSDAAVGNKLQYEGVGGAASGGPTNVCAGGSCGGYITGTLTLTETGKCVVVVGAGTGFATTGAGIPGNPSYSSYPGGSLYAPGGGATPDWTASPYNTPTPGGGGGMGAGRPGPAFPGGGILRGGSGHASGGGGGGGAGSVGLDGAATGAQGGGPVTSAFRTGVNVQLCAGGGAAGGSAPYGGPGGSPAAGDGTLGTDHANGDGQPNLGMGGGGVYSFAAETGRGGSGRWTYKYRIA